MPDTSERPNSALPFSVENLEGRMQVIEQLLGLLAEHRKLLEGRLTDQVVLQYKDQEMQIRELFQRLADGNRPAK